jgi:hypothetical protein
MPFYGLSPAYFKVKIGTGLKEQTEAYCPYCRAIKEPATGFMTTAQMDYIKSLVAREAMQGIQDSFKNVFRNSPKPKRGEFFSISWEYKPGSLPYVSAPAEEHLRRDVTCPNCTLQHAVFGLATWCPDCGKDIFLTHLEAEFATISLMLNDIPRRYKELGARVASRDLENALEDAVSIFESVLRVMTRRSKEKQGLTFADIENLFKKTIRNGFQNIGFAEEYFRSDLKVELFAPLSEGQLKKLKHTFEKRHPITHNLGIMDQAYLKKVQTAEAEGRDVKLSNQEIADAIGSIQTSLRAAYPVMFP